MSKVIFYISRLLSVKNETMPIADKTIFLMSGNKGLNLNGSRRRRHHRHCKSLMDALPNQIRRPWHINSNSGTRPLP